MRQALERKQMKSIVKKAREIVTQLYERNMVAWNDLDRKVVFAIQALIAEVQRMEALAQPEQEPVAWKLVPIEPTRKMLEAMDECSMEGYDEHLYAGHAASVYMAAVDVAPTPPQPEKPDQDEVDIRSRLYQRIHELETQLAQPDQEPVAWRYKPVRENNPRWEYTTKHPLDMGDGYLRPTLVEYCKCIEPLYAKEKPKLMLEKFREMKDLLDDPTPPQRTWVGLTDEEAQQTFAKHNVTISADLAGILTRAIEAKLKEKNGYAEEKNT